MRDLARYIDHTLLKPTATEADILKLCDEARAYGFYAVCVNPYWVRTAARRLADTPVRVCTVIGFPLGATPTAVKVYETTQALSDGASEVDMVLNVGALKSGHESAVRDDIAAVVEAAQGKALVKVILETALLTDEEKVRACQLAKEAGAHYVKTSTGFGPGGATVADVRLMRETVGPEMDVKASGGVRDAQTARAMIEAGATRIGTSSGVAIVTGAQPAGNGY